MTRLQPIRALPILLALLFSPLSQAHQPVEPTAQNSLQAVIQLDVRRLNLDSATSASLPLAGIAPLRQEEWLYGRSGFGLRSNRTLYGQNIDVEAAWAYSDQEQKLLADHIRLGWQIQPQLRIDLGRMNPLPAEQPAAWPVADLLMQGLLGDDHWHADGAMLQVGTTAQRLRVGAFRAPAYRGGQSRNASQDTANVALWSLGANTTYRDINLSAGLLHVPDLIRESTRDNSDVPLPHTHDTDISACGRSLTCVDGNANLVWLGSRWQPTESAFSVAGYAMWRQERGVLNGVNGLVDYQGDLYGGLVDIGYAWTDRLSTTVRAETLSIQHEIKGLNARVITRDAGLLDNDVTPKRFGVWFSYALPVMAQQRVTLNAAVLEDQTRPKSELISTIGLVWRAETTLWPH